MGEGRPRHVPDLGDGWAPTRRLVEHAPVAAVLVDEDERIRYANPLVESTFGHRPEELRGQALSVLLPDLHVGSLLDEAEGQRVVSVTGRHRDERSLPVDARLTPVTVADGSTGVLVGMSDMSARDAAVADLEQVSRSYQTLAQMNQAIVRARDADSLFTQTCRVAVSFGGYLGAWVGRRAAGSEWVEPVTTAGVLDEYIHRLRISLDPASPQGNGPTALALRDGNPYYSGDFMSDEVTSPWHALAATYGIAASATLPLRCNGQPVAVLTLYSGRAASFDERMRGELVQLAENVSYALGAFAARDSLKQTHAQLQAVVEQREDLMRRLVTAEEAERARIAGDVHDDSVQALAAIDLRLGLLRRRTADVAPTLVAEVERVQAATVDAAAGLRRLLADLDPPPEEASCAEAVRLAAEQVFEGQDTQWRLDCDAEVHLPDVEQLQALRIVKEALINVRKHAHAAHVDIAVRSQPDAVEVAISDDGVGLPAGVDPDQLPRSTGHRGMQTMRDRAVMAGGWCRLERRPRGGTVVRFRIPRGSVTAGRE